MRGSLGDGTVSCFMRMWSRTARRRRRSRDAPATRHSPIPRQRNETPVVAPPSFLGSCPREHDRGSRIADPRLVARLAPLHGLQNRTTRLGPMAIVLKWFRALRFSYWRRCRSCSLRGSKCLCRRHSLTMEQIFFIEERKNKYGRNFSHVSDTVVSASTSGSSGSSSLLSTGTSFGAGYGPGEFYHATQQEPTTTSTAIVRKNSGTMVPMHNRYSQDDMHCNYNGDYNGYRHDSRRQRRQLPPSTTSLASRQEDSSLSLQVYNRKQQRSGRSGSRTSSRMSAADSIIVRPSSSSSIRASVASDRMSIDNNTGSYNPQSRFYGASYAPSIQEDDDDVQARLNGLLLQPSPASSTSTILERSRYRQYY